MPTMKEIKEVAKKRRAKYLAELERRECTIRILAAKYKISDARMGQHIIKAKKERENE